MSDIKALNQARYGTVAQEYVQSAVHASRQDLDRLIAISQPQSDWVMLDVATGGGHTALAFVPYVAQMTAYDLTLPMLEAMRHHADAVTTYPMTYVQGDAEYLPFKDETFDAVSCRLATHHFGDIQQFFKEVSRVLKPNGRLILQDHLAPHKRKDALYLDAFEALRDPSHVRAIHIYEWRRLCREANLFILHEETAIRTHALVEWAERQQCPPEVIEYLQIMLIQAPERVKETLHPQHAGTPFATFDTPNVFLCAQKQMP